MARMRGFPKTIDHVNTGISDISFSSPVSEERFYGIVKVSGAIANCAVEEITVKGNSIVSREIITDRDNKPGTLARAMDILSRSLK